MRLCAICRVIPIAVLLECIHACAQPNRIKHLLLYDIEYRIFQKMRRDPRRVAARVHVLVGAAIALVR